MIVKLVHWRGSGSYLQRGRDLVNYIATPETEDAREKCVHLAATGTISPEPGTALREMEAVLGSHILTAPQRTCPYEHWILSWHERDMPHREDADRAVRVFLNNIRFGNRQAIYGLHANTDNLHAHICVSRYDPLRDQLTNLTPMRHIDGHRAICHVEHDGGWKSTPNALFAWNTQKNAPERRFREAVSLPPGHVSPKPLRRPLPTPPVMPDIYEVRRDPRNVWYLRNNRAIFLWRDGQFFCCDWNLRQSLRDFLNCSPDAPLFVKDDILPWMQRQAKKNGSFPVVGVAESLLPPPLLPPSRPVSVRQYEALRKRALADGESPSGAECVALVSLRRLGGSRENIEAIARQCSEQPDAYRERILTWVFGPRGDAYLTRNGFRFLDHVPSRPAAPKPTQVIEPEKRPRRRRAPEAERPDIPQQETPITRPPKKLFGKRRRHSFQNDDFPPRSIMRQEENDKKVRQREEEGMRL